MALIDINFQEAEGQDFILEIELGSLNSPIDILFTEGGDDYAVYEIGAGTVSGGNIFIMSE